MIHPQDNSRLALITAAQNFTAGWVDLGDEINVADMKQATLWLNIDINNSTDTRVRALVRGLDSTDWYYLPLEAVAAGVITVTPSLYYEFGSDADQLVAIPITLNDAYPVMKFQIQAGVVGATAGQVDAAHVSLSRERGK